MRTGIIGRHLDGADWSELNRIGALDFVNTPRERAVVFGFRMPWPQGNETYRERLWKVLCTRMTQADGFKVIGSSA